jgi:2-polyprenyl-3-methyl-5-hydroxy-6-metoxy-1,4-benzoquinol methylase
VFVITSWKTRLYDAYVSSGQASITDEKVGKLDKERVLGPRATYIRNLISRYIPSNRDARVLDLGCGSGAFLYYLRAAGYTNVSGIDISQQQIELAHKLGVTEAKCSSILSELKTTDSESLDVVLMMDILEHLDDSELFEVLDQVFRVVKDGGICVAHVPNAEGLYGMRIRYGDLTHERAFAPKSVKQLFQTIGFTEVRCFEDKPQVHGLKSLARRVAWKAGTLSHRVLLTAETGETGFVLSQNMLIMARK